ncbi:polysaccharide pyruvyl transferase family protein [Kocuria sp. CPCC 205292]|uniref:polysaccharide pyruvyl transferase family protein n=1 Tax=Kocuria cellulosilytica TaxID=3071451 RepID=UPI0034D6FE82
MLSISSALQGFTTLTTSKHDSGSARFELVPSDLDDLLVGSPKICIIGNYGQGNVGDESLLAGTLSLINGRGDLTVLSKNPERVAALHKVPAAAMKSFRGVWALLRSPVVIVGGGGMFGAGQPPLVSLLAFVLLIEATLGRRVGLIGIGVYPGVPGIVAWALRRLSSRASFVAIRDEASREVFSGAKLCADLAFSVTPASRDELNRLRKTHGIAAEGLMVMSLKPAPDIKLIQSQVEVACIAARAWLNAGMHHQLVFVCLSALGDFGWGRTHTDESMAAAVINQVKGEVPSYSTRVVCITPELSPALAKALIGSADKVVGARYHAMVFGASMDRPTLGLVFEPKAQRFCDEYDISQFALPYGDVQHLLGWVRN